MAGTRNVKRLFDLEIDEISLVDRSANQHADVAIAKRDEDTMTVMDAEGREVSLEELEPGQIVFDSESGEALVACEEGSEPEDYYDFTDEAEEPAEERELATVGKGLLARKPVAKSLGSDVYETLSKALNDDARNDVISKALAEADERVSKAEAAAAQAVSIAQTMAEELELAQLTEVAKSYSLPGEPEVMAEILKSMPPQHAAYLDRVLSSVGEQLFETYGADLGDQHASIHAQIEAIAGEAVGKSNVSGEQAVVALYDANPDAYDQYLAENA
jgi:hypothetical protein